MSPRDTAEGADAAEKVYPIRELRESDLPEILRIVRDSPTAPQWTEGQFREILRGHLDASVALLRSVRVLETSHGIAGFAVATALRVVYPAEAELESIAVAPAMRGQGIGRALVNAVVDWAAANGADALRLEVRVSNREALHLYCAMKFREIGVRRSYYLNPPEDAVCMARTISVQSADEGAVKVT